MTKQNNRTLADANVIPEGGLTLAGGQILELETWGREDGFLYRARVTDDEERLVFSVMIDPAFLVVLEEAVDALKRHRDGAARACSTMTDAFDELEDMSLVARK